MAIVTQNYTVESEIASDNYINTSTFYNTNFDNPVIQFADADVNNFLFTISDLRESARIGLSIIAPSDTSTTNADLAEMFYFKGISFLLSAENLVANPVEPGGVPQPFSVNYDSAVANFTTALQLAPGNASYHLILARTYYGMGDRANAVTQANAALAADAALLRVIEYDNLNTPTNIMQNAIYDRANFDLQPLPRLDFLDPKFAVTGANEADQPFVKAEEAHLILAEAAIASGNLNEAQTHFTNLLALVATRPTTTVPETDQRRENSGTGPARPNGSAIEVRASASDPFKAGLLLTRSTFEVGNIVEVTVPSISGTSVIQADVDGLTNLDDALELCYLLRQEVFIAEGRRMNDLGIRWPLSQNELLQNPNLNDGDSELQAIIPSFIPTDKGMDAFTWDVANDQVTITFNMNRVLVENKTNNNVVPFE